MSEPTVWYAIPSARSDGGTLCFWQERGYGVAVFRDYDAAPLSLKNDKPNMTLTGVYPGYAEAVNALAAEVLRVFPDTKIIVTGGDDVDPPDADPYKIQAEFVEHFPDLYGVMQPTGDRWMVDDNGKSCSERVAYSPWMGRGWVLEANQGKGPLWPGYHHFFVDEHLQRAAEMQGVFWQRPDLCQYHHWWGRQGEDGKRPQHLISKAKPEAWESGKRLFEEHKAQGFKESLPLPKSV